MSTFENIPEVPKGYPDAWNFFNNVKKVTEKVVSLFTENSKAATTPLLLNAWKHYGNPYGPVSYRKEFGRVVILSGMVKSGTIGQNIFILPVEYRPKNDLLFPVASNDAFGICKITTTGEVLPLVGNNTYFSLDGISFRID